MARSPQPLVRIAMPAMLLCIALHLVVGIAVLVRSPEHFTNPQLLTKDSRGYYLLGQNVLEHGVFSRSEKPPLVPDMVRTPAYPLLVGTLSKAIGLPAVFLAQVLLALASCLVVTAIAVRLGNERLGLWAGVLFATELSLLESSFDIEAEGLFLFLSLSSVLCVVSWFKRANSETGHVALAAAALLASLACMARPSALYLPAVFAIAIVIEAVREGRLGQALRPLVIVAVIGYSFPAAWIVRNHLVLGYPRLTTVDMHGLIYYVGGGAYEIKHRVPFEEAREMISREFNIPPYGVVHNPQVDRSVPEMERQLVAVQWKVLFRYPRELALSLVLGVTKALFGHSNDTLATLTSTTWKPPGLSNLDSAGLSRLWQRLQDNHPLLVLSFFFQLAHSALVNTLAPIGLLLALGRGPQNRVVALVALFFLVTVCMFGLNSGARARSPLVPFLCIGAAMAIVAGLELIASRRSRER